MPGWNHPVQFCGAEYCRLPNHLERGVEQGSRSPRKPRQDLSRLPLRISLAVVRAKTASAAKRRTSPIHQACPRQHATRVRVVRFDSQAVAEKMFSRELPLLAALLTKHYVPLERVSQGIKKEKGVR